MTFLICTFPSKQKATWAFDAVQKCSGKCRDNLKSCLVLISIGDVRVTDCLCVIENQGSNGIFNL